MGYKQDIDSLLNDLHLNKNDLFKFVLEFLSKSNKKENEIRIIASYLFSMQGLINLLLKTIDLTLDKLSIEQQLLNDLLALASILTYEKFPKNSILIRFGEKGSKAYLSLSGDVAVLIKKQFKLYLTEEEYLHYLANLIKYNEYELVNIIINENFKTLPIEIIDDINEQDFDKRKSISTSVKDLNKFNNLEKAENTFNILRPHKVFSSFNLNKMDKITYIKPSQKNNTRLKLNQENEKLKQLAAPTLYYASKLFKNYRLQLLPKKLLNKCSVEEYINRLNVIDDFDFNEEEYNNLNANGKGKTYLSIYSYIKVVNLPKGSLFGDMALNNKNSLRTATIISLEDCYCGVLNKKSYTNSLKNSAEKNLRDILEFIVDLPLFKGLQPAFFLRKYFTNLSRNNNFKNVKIMTQGEKPEYIALLKTGQYSIYTYNSLFNISNLMIYYMKLKQKIKKDDEMANKIIQSLKITNKLLIENEKFRKFYFSKNNYTIGVISSPDIIGYNEFIGQDGKYAFNIETAKLKNDYFLLKIDFYEDIMQKNELVRNNQDKLYNSKLDLMLERLYNMRKIEISTFLEYKTYIELGNSVAKEIDDSIEKQIKFKRTIKFNSTDYKISLSQKEKISNNNTINTNKSIGDTNYLDSSNKKSTILTNKQSRKRITVINLKDIAKSDNLMINSNTFNLKKLLNRNKKGDAYPIIKANNYLDFFDSDNKILSSNLSNKNYNKTLSYFNKNSKNKMKVKKKIENYSQNKNKKKMKKINFDGVCLNNMILEDIQEKIKFPIYDYNSKDKKTYIRNKSKRLNKFIIYQRLYNSLKNNKAINKMEPEKSISSLSEEYLKTVPIKINREKAEKVIKINRLKNKVNYRNKILGLKQNTELDKNNYDIERNNYYKKTISKRLNFFFGGKKK
jgi:CRP-like cAMP-binding protein